MRAHLIFRSAEFEWRAALQAASEREAAHMGRRYYPGQGARYPSHLPWNADELTADLDLNTLFGVMSQGDDCVFEVARRVVLQGVNGDLETIRYRQENLQDCISHQSVVRELYGVAVRASEKLKPSYLGNLASHPDWVLRYSIETMEDSFSFLKELRAIGDLHAKDFLSDGWTRFFKMAELDLDDAYLASIERHVNQLKFREGVHLSAELAVANKGSHYLLHLPPRRSWSFKALYESLFSSRRSRLSFSVDPRDESGARALNELRNRGTSLAATAIGQAADHVRDFFNMLRVELAFYVGCINLHNRLVLKGEPVCIPVPVPDGQRLSFQDLYDVGLTLSVDRPVVGNEAEADGKNLIMITGANNGGKSTLLRAMGLAQLMMQSGMFVPAKSFTSSVCNGLFSHFKREEDESMKSGKFDEELGRMSDIVDHLRSGSMLLLNESFSSTNEREGSEIARQVIAALLRGGMRVICVTHLYQLAQGFYGTNRHNALFLRASREADGNRTFKLVEGEPLAVSFGEDLYYRVFDEEAGTLHSWTDSAPRLPDVPMKPRAERDAAPTAEEGRS